MRARRARARRAGGAAVPGLTRTRLDRRGVCSWRPCSFAPVIPPPTSRCPQSIERARSRSTTIAVAVRSWSPCSAGCTAPSAGASSCSWAPRRTSSRRWAWRRWRWSIPRWSARGSTSSIAPRACCSPRTRRRRRTGRFGCPRACSSRTNRKPRGPREGHDGSVAGGTDQSHRGAPAPQNPFVAMETLNKRDGFELTEIDQQIAAAHGTAAGRALPHRPGRDHPLAADRGRRADRRPLQVPERRGDPARGPQPLD